MTNHDEELSALGAAWPIGWSTGPVQGWFYCKLTDSVLVRAYPLSAARRGISACSTVGLDGVKIENMPSTYTGNGLTWAEAVSALRKDMDTGFDTATTLIRFLPPREPAKPQASGELPPGFQPPSSTRMEPGESPTFQTIAAEVAKLVESKQAAYGDSFGRSGDILRVLYPHGIKPEQYTDALAVVRVVDKLFRVATDKDAFGESPWRDIMGYALLAVEREGRG